VAEGEEGGSKKTYVAMKKACACDACRAVSSWLPGEVPL